MKEKNGFIFIETIVVLTVTMVSLLTLYDAYALVLKSASSKQYNDNINDIYKVNIVKNMLLSENYPCPTVSGNYNLYTSENCGSVMNNDCGEILDEFDIKQVIFTRTLVSQNTIKNLISYGKLNNGNVFTNSLNRYISNLDLKAKYIIIVREVDDKKYYASLKCGEISET